MPISWLHDRNPQKTAFFNAIAAAEGAGKRLPNWPVSFRGYPETSARAGECLERAKKQPRTGLGRWIKESFLRGRYNWSRRYFTANPHEIAACWQGLTGTRRAFMLGALDAGAPRLFAELAPLPGYKTLDPSGVNAEGSVPRDPKTFTKIEPNALLLSEIKNQLAARPSRRSDVGQTALDAEAAGNFLFVPLQVPDDSQMLLFADWVGSATGFVDALAVASAQLPDGWHLRLKEHPSSRIRLTEQIEQAIANGARLVLDNQSDSFEQIRASKGVVTVNSSMGLQAMFFGKAVITAGQAFFAQPGLTHHVESAGALAHSLSVVETISFDADLRQRFLTWLASEYYVRETDEGYDMAQIKSCIEKARG